MGVRVHVRTFHAAGASINVAASDQEISNAGQLENGAIALNFDSYAAMLKGTFQGDAFDGE